MLKDKIVFISDVHLGFRCGDYVRREKEFSEFLSQVSKEVDAIYLLGDIFDFWYEYKYVIPKGFTRTLGTLAKIADSGVEVYFMRGNHDLWIFGYFEQELGFKILKQPQILEIGGKTFCLGHGDGLGYTKLSFRLLRWAFYNRFLQVLFSSLHPRWALSIGYRWSKGSRLSKKNNPHPYTFRGKEEPIYRFSERLNEERVVNGLSPVDYFIYGHFHQKVHLDMPYEASFFILDDWIKNPGNCIFFDTKTSQIEVRSPMTEGNPQ